MNAIQDLFIDFLNGFSLSQVPLFLFQLLAAGLMSHVLQLIWNKKMGKKSLKQSALISIAVAVLVSLVKNTEPLGILGAAVILLLFRTKEQSRLDQIGQFLVVAIGLGCGIGSVFQTAIGALFIGLVILFTPLKKEDA